MSFSTRLPSGASASMEVDRAPHRDHSDDDNQVAPLVLGARKLLDDFGREAARMRADGGALPDDDPILAAALGFISLRRTLERWLRQTEATSPARGETRPSVDDGTALLR
jgi:hypothetical protein